MHEILRISQSTSFPTRLASLLVAATCLLAACAPQSSTSFTAGATIPTTGTGTTNASAWVSGLAADNVAVVGSSELSSSKLEITWQARSGTDHYELTLTDQIGGSVVSARVSGSDSQVTISGLKSETPHTAAIVACEDSACQNQTAGSASAQATTAAEVWQLQGSGNSFDTATLLLSDGNVGSHAFRYGPGSGALEGHCNLYYVPMAGSEKGIKIATTSLQATDLATATNYAAGSVSLYRQGSGLATSLALFQAVPLASGTVRLYMEAEGDDGSTRIMHLDSSDGYVGRDFNGTSASDCTGADFVSGGCVPTVDIGVEGDAVKGNRFVDSARQFKVAFPTQDDWRWDESAGTFMVFTLHTDATGCSSSRFNGGYAVWNGAQWEVQYDTTTGCPKVFEGVQAPMPVHTGGVGYKMYYSYHDPALGANALKQMRLLYADGALTSNPDTVEFEDWETMAQARSPKYIWPDGSAFTDADEDNLDDYVIFQPTGSSDLQVMYSNLGGPNGTRVPEIGTLVLINP